MEGGQLGLENERKLNGEVMISSKSNGFETEANNVEKIQCNGNGMETDVIAAKKEIKNLENELLEDLDSYWEDINDRLVISRMVNDSVIKGMVNAVEQEASERIAMKELEVARLKQFCELEVDKIKSVELLMKDNGLASESWARQLRHSDVCVQHDEMRESVRSLKVAATEQFRTMKKEIDDARGCASIKRIGSGSELLGLGGILQGKECESWAHMDKMLTTVKDIIDPIWGRVDDVLQLSKTSLCEWKQEQEFREETEAIVMQSAIRSLQKEFEETLRDQNAKFGGICSVNWPEKLNELSSLRDELDGMLKSLSTPETGQLSSHGSLDMDNNSHQKAVVTSVVSSASDWRGNGKLEDSKIDMPENYDAAQLKHMSKDELVTYFNSIITKTRRDYESLVQKKTEEYFSLKREYLNIKERGSPLPHRKDNKEFDTIKRKIPNLIMKLERILADNGIAPAPTDNGESFANLKDRVGSLLSENRQLRDLLSDKKTELKHLTSQVSDAEEKMLQHSLAVVDAQNIIADLSSTIQDVRIASDINEEIYKCFLMDLSGQMRQDREESAMEFLMMKEIYDIIFREAFFSDESVNGCYIEDSDIDALIMHEICGLILRETTKDGVEKLKELHSGYLSETEKVITLEKNALENEKRIIADKERLRQEVLTLEAFLQEKEEYVKTLSVSRTKEREQLELLSQELKNVKEHASSQQGEICQLREMLETKNWELKKADEQREAIVGLSEERHKKLLLAKDEEKELKKQMKAVIVNVHGLSNLFDHFEGKVAGSIEKNVLRLENLGLQLKPLVKGANSLRQTKLMYKEKLERTSTDLQMAEAEVDLLGDEVEALSGLLEKIYIALDHYSPILKHYPGVMETLQLVRRELLGEPTKSRRSP